MPIYGAETIAMTGLRCYPLVVAAVTASSLSLFAYRTALPHYPNQEVGQFVGNLARTQ